ncbi:MAG TPA: carbonate dehydratase [Sedimentisphaerales bacterium]|nr:carbonate dehydratase [Sedimentisphaerales bacterium]
MRILPKLFENNRNWAAGRRASDPDFFARLVGQHAPEFLWIGCADSRVPANEIVGLLSGELFVHRNIANLVLHSDFNCLSVLQYAVDVLKVRHIIVCGHYGCGGVTAAIEDRSHGLVDNWLRPIRDIWRARAAELSRLGTDQKRLDRLCELNVIQQVMNVGNTTVLQGAWDRNQEVTIHGWVYSIGDGLLRDLDVCISSRSELKALENRENPRGKE